MPSTPLTSILKDFRAYRPGNHREFLEYVQNRSAEIGLTNYALSSPHSAALYLQALNQVRDFRWRHVRPHAQFSFCRSWFTDPPLPALHHIFQPPCLLVRGSLKLTRSPKWCFTREYILKKSKHPTATGGSPIVTWLPNQLTAVIDAMAAVWEGAGKSLPGCQDIMEATYLQRDTLRKEVDKYCSERGDDAKVAKVA